MSSNKVDCDNLTDEQLDELRLYLRTLDSFFPHLGEEYKFSEENLPNLTFMYQLIEDFGNGDPVKAATRHAKCLIGYRDAIELMNGHQSKMTH